MKLTEAGIYEVAGVLAGNIWLEAYEGAGAIAVTCQSGAKLTPSQARRFAAQLVRLAGRIERRSGEAAAGRRAMQAQEPRDA